MWPIAKSLLLVAFASIEIHARRLTGEEQAQVKLASEAAGRAEAGALTELGAESDSKWQPKDYRFCISEEAELACDTDSIIKVRTAMYNKIKKDTQTGKTCEPGTAGTDSSFPCSAKNTDKIKDKCDGLTTCTILPSEHRLCTKSPFTFMRVNYECESAPPRQEKKHNSATLGTETYVEPVKLPQPDNSEAPSKVIEDTLTGEKVMDDTKPVKIKGDKGIMARKDVEMQKQRTEEYSMKPCYRLDRGTKFWRMDYLGRLTTCAEYEGCFKVRFENEQGKEVWFTHEKETPPVEELLKGELVQSRDNPLITWKGIGLKRNDYWSWGICLPKTKGVAFALQTWESLKEISQGFK